MRGTSAPHTYQSTPRLSRTTATGSPALVFTHWTISSLNFGSGVAVGAVVGVAVREAVGEAVGDAPIPDTAADDSGVDVGEAAVAVTTAALLTSALATVSGRTSAVAGGDDASAPAEPTLLENADGAAWAELAALIASTRESNAQPVKVRLTAPMVVVSFRVVNSLLVLLRGDT